VLDYFQAPARQAATVREVGHRPYPLPKGSWVMGQTWQQQLFVHWPVEYLALRALVPEGLPLDRFDGKAWVGVTPFLLTGLRATATPPVPVLSTFPELNVRTYVTLEEKPGIYFFSLDAASRLAVAAARRFYCLPYFHARMSARREEGEVRYASERVDQRGQPAEFRARYGPAGTPFEATPGSIEHFLAERYCLYTLNRSGHVLRAEIHHPPWLLQPAHAELERNTMAPPGLTLRGSPALLHFAERQDVLIWGPGRL
jgi:uncharacterized protein